MKGLIPFKPFMLDKIRISDWRMELHPCADFYLPHLLLQDFQDRNQDFRRLPKGIRKRAWIAAIVSTIFSTEFSSYRTQSNEYLGFVLHFASILW